MNLTHTAYGTWSAGKFMHFGESVDDDRFLSLIRHAYDSGVRTFVTADVYGAGRADEMLGEALDGIDRETYCLVGAIGHDFYKGQRAGSKGYPRFTHPDLRDSSDYANYVEEATKTSLDRCRTDHFDLLMLHNPDSIGYTSESVWEAMRGAKDSGQTRMLGIAPGPANGFTMDIAQCFERFGELIDWAMIILNPLEPWPGRYVLPAAQEFGVDILTRVVDYGGIFHDDMKPGHHFRDGDHRTYRPEGWVEAGNEKLERFREFADRHQLTMLQLASQWNLSQSPVKCVVPTIIQEAEQNNGKSAEDKITELSKVPSTPVLSPEEIDAIAAIGDNLGCMPLKGASTRYNEDEPQADHWPMRKDLETVAERWQLDPTW